MQSFGIVFLQRPQEQPPVCSIGRLMAAVSSAKESVSLSDEHSVGRQRRSKNRDNAFRGCSLDLSGAPPYWLSRCENIRHRLVRFSPYRVARRVASLGRAAHLACEPFDKALALALRSDGATGRP